LADSTLEALAQDHWNDCWGNVVAAIALVCTLKSSSLWFLDPVGVIFISFHSIYYSIAEHFVERMQVDLIKAYHFGPKFLVEIKMVMP
jgi:divalent metal cation (Fe/Co/Zn/Cd) transporter